MTADTEAAMRERLIADLLAAEHIDAGTLALLAHVGAALEALRRPYSAIPAEIQNGPPAPEPPPSAAPAPIRRASTAPTAPEPSLPMSAMARRLSCGFIAAPSWSSSSRSNPPARSGSPPG